MALLHGARINPNGASDANGAADANGAPDARINEERNHGAPDATHGQQPGRPQRRTGGGGRTRRRASRDNRHTAHDGQAREPAANMVLTLIDKITRSIPYPSTLDTRQLGSHTWSDQLVPLIWCATCDNTCEQLRRALAELDRGHEALMAFRTWWIEQGVHTAEDAIPLLNTIARQQGVRGPPMRCYQYLQAPVQEHIAALSGAEYL